jgi:hypothetical protein
MLCQVSQIHSHFHVLILRGFKRMSQMLFQLVTLNVDHNCRTVVFTVITFLLIISDTLEITVLSASDAFH